MTEDPTPDQRLRAIARQSLANYRRGEISLKRLVDNLDEVWSNLELSTWREEFRGHWWTLEQVYASAVDRDDLGVVQADVSGDIAEAINALERLLE